MADDEAHNARQALSRYFPIWTEYIREILLSSVEDGISYTEPRIAFWYKCVALCLVLLSSLIGCRQDT